MKCKSIKILASILILTSGCTTFPERAKITAFGDAAVTVSEAVNDAYDTHVTLAYLAAQEEQASRYVAREDFQFPPDSSNFSIVSNEIWALRINVLKSVSSYAESLSKISEPGASKEIAASGSRLVSSVLQLANTLSEFSNPNLEVATNVTEFVIQAASNRLFASNVREAIINTDPAIQTLSELLTQDISSLENLPVYDAETLAAERETILRDIQNDRSVSSIQRYDQYLEMVEAQQLDEARLIIFSKSKAFLDNFAKAHSDLLKSEDTNRSFDDFISSANQIASIIEQVAQEE